ncbi:MAG TPA: hypothetical protein VGR27_15700 [Longimicrobiaceae bacterium]|nr:hypothetical protein [Longimicrobiaceae bacterium]
MTDYARLRATDGAAAQPRRERTYSNTEILSTPEMIRSRFAC